MGVFDKFADAPNQIKIEGQEITIKFQRTSDTTARISWNIPPPAAGCAAGDQAYDGIVITVNRAPADYLKTSPKNGTYYTADPTADTDLHAADKIDTALVIGAFYHDKTTTILDISGIQPRTPYYVSGYAVDKVGRYHREGVHAYSLPTGAEESPAVDKAAYHNIAIDVLGGVKTNTSTGLNQFTTYSFTIIINCKEYTIEIDGIDGLTYGDLVSAINKELALLEDPFEGPNPPNTSGYYYDQLNNKLYQWTGTQHVVLDVIVSATDPANPADGTYWWDVVDEVLYIRDAGAWVAVTYIKHNAKPNELECGQLWYDGTNVWEWDGNHWCKLCLYAQVRNPALGPLLSCNTYWFDNDESVLTRWDVDQKRWVDAVAIYSTQDPNTLNTGDWWYDETAEKIKQFISGEWELGTNVRYEERNEDGDLDNPVANSYWYIPTEQLFFRRNSGNTAWVEISFTSFPTDPRDRKSCDLWWDSTPSIDYLYAWDLLHSEWVAVEVFYKTSGDPSLPPDLPECAVWYNPDTDEFKKISDLTCDDANPIRFATDPNDLGDGTVWFDTINSKWWVWNGTTWTEFDPIDSNEDPTDLDVGEFWYDTSTDELNQWDGSAWNQITYSTTPLTPTVGTLWFNTVDEILLKWSGTAWVPAVSLAYAEFCQATKSWERSYISFYTRDTGCPYDVEVVAENENLFALLGHSVIFYDPVTGNSGVDSGPMYRHLGVGDDGSPDERRKLHDDIRISLGYPSVQVELTKEQLDRCIDNALAELRKGSGFGYTRGYFFLDLKPNQQTYIMANKCVGFNKIVEVTAIHRMKAGVFRGALLNSDIHAYAALQQLYTLGTFDILTYHLAASYIEELETLFATRILHQFVERTRELRLLQMIASKERVLVEASLERTEQELITDRYTGIWIQKWAVAEAKHMLSQIRGKFQTLPGPTGSTTLNSQELSSQAEQEKQELRTMLEDMGMQDIANIGMRAHFISG